MTLRIKRPHLVGGSVGVQSSYDSEGIPPSKEHTMTINYRHYVVRDPAICGGEPVVRGTRVTVRTVLASLAEGMSVAEIVKDFPTLDEEAVRAVIAFAAASAEEDSPVPPIPSLA